MLSRFLDWLDESAAGVIRVAYLLAGVIAVASYFSDGHVPSGLAQALNAVLPWALAGALEVHTYLSARRVRAAWQDMQAAKLGSDDYEKAEQTLKVNLGILAGLLLFSIYNQLQYLASTWTPPHTPLTPPGGWPYLIRALITPSAFMAAAFLAPIGEGMAAQVQREAHTLARLAFKAASAQWKRRLREMQQQQQDVTGALVGLVEDQSERRVIEGIWRAMHPGQSLAALDAPGMPAGSLPPVPPTLPDPPPNGPQTPPDDDERDTWRDTSREWPSLHMVPGRTRMSRNERRKLSRTLAQRDEAFGWLDGDPTMSRTQLKELLHCRQDTANKFWAQWHNERRMAAQS